MKGYTIDCNFLIRVKDIMNLPRPTRKHIINDGEYLPIISIGVEE